MKKSSQGLLRKTSKTSIGHLKKEVTPAGFKPTTFRTGIFLLLNCKLLTTNT